MLCLIFCVYTSVKYSKNNNMKRIITSLFILSSALVMAQTGAVKGNAQVVSPQDAANIRQASSQTGSPDQVSRTVQVRVSEPTAPLYDVEDRYMGRTQEFLSSLTVT